jgi:hypothetical protein
VARTGRCQEVRRQGRLCLHGIDAEVARDLGKGVEISVLSNDSIVKAAEIRSGSRRL